MADDSSDPEVLLNEGGPIVEGPKESAAFGRPETGTGRGAEPATAIPLVEEAPGRPETWAGAVAGPAPMVSRAEDASGRLEMGRGAVAEPALVVCRAEGSSGKPETAAEVAEKPAPPLPWAEDASGAPETGPSASLGPVSGRPARDLGNSEGCTREFPASEKGNECELGGQPGDSASPDDAPKPGRCVFGLPNAAAGLPPEVMKPPVGPVPVTRKTRKMKQPRVRLLQRWHGFPKENELAHKTAILFTVKSTV